MTIREQLTKLGTSDAPPGSSWFVQLIWKAIDLDEPALVQLDKDLAQPIWKNGHTISWNLGKMVVDGDPIAIAECDVLSELLGKDHCKNAYEHGD